MVDKFKPTEEDYTKDTVQSIGVFVPPVSPGAETHITAVEDDSGEPITAQGTTKYYPPTTIPKGVFNDNFSGDDGHPPHRGKWIIFLTRDEGVTGKGYDLRTCETLENELHMKINGDAGGSGLVGIHCLSRAEIKPPFIVAFKVRPKEAASQYFDRLAFSLVSPDPQDGESLLGSNLYGVPRITWKATVDGARYWTVQDDDGITWSDAGAWLPDYDYDVVLKVGYLPGTGNNLVVETTIKQGTTTVFSAISRYVIRSRSGNLRFMFSAWTDQSLGGYTEFFADNFKVSRNALKKAVCRVSLAHQGTFIMASDDVEDFQVDRRKGSCAAASLTLKNETGRYFDLSVTDEIEIRAGPEHIQYLLFRGNIDEPEKTFPPAELRISSTKGFTKRLDFRETDGESWSDELSGSIVEGIIADYFAGVFSADWVSAGVTVSLDSDDEPVSTVIRTLADTNGFSVDVDFNKSLHFVDPDLETTQSNLELKQAEQILAIKDRLVDEIINSITVKGATHTYNAQDAESIAAYWLREKTFTDESLTSAGAVQARVEELLAIYKDPKREIPIDLPEIFVLEINDKVLVTCPAVDLDEVEIITGGVSYTYDGSGFRTKIQGSYTGFLLSDILVDHERKLGSG